MELTREKIQYARWGIMLDTKACANCKHFYQHYTKCGDLFVSGHCCYPRMKPRKVWDTCERFQEKEVK